MPSDYRDQDLLELMVERIEHIQRRPRKLDESAFLADQDEIDLTCFRLLHMGEAANKLSSAIKLRHTDIPWIHIYGMRNIVSHDYFGVNPAIVRMTATTRLDQLRARCRSELDNPPS
ncbi:MAG: HepT-like ribonuclease domain-containing protein [Pseudomonadota bacterium]|jgi:uncharacterized protein with HEPN domain|nr:HepT-like ribonuclease domain-containing protein [Pseudomonadota bacterium]